ncbi:MAG: galactokinase [Pseudomonadota bacterium]|nr:galactokinase [Pseudomonadota bacterium]
MIDELHQLFRESFGASPELVARAPGRVNLIGEHTDYNDGFVLPCAISRQTMVAARRRDDRQVRIVAGDLGGVTTVFSLAEPISPDGTAPWSNYVRGVADGLLAAGVELPGADLAIMGDMPQGAGLSSSAALENAAGLALAALAGQPDFDRSRLALIGQRAEHNFAGCQCGIMDQLVSARSVAGSALLIDCRSLDCTPVTLPADLAVMIVHSGIERGLVDGEYNLRRQQCEAAARHFGVAALRDLDALPEPGGLDPVAYARARHVVGENARTLAAAEALRNGDRARLGQLMAESHAAMRDDFQITLPAIDALVALLQQAIGGAGGARMTGGGFGGAVVALLPAAEVERVRTAVLAGYRTPAGEPPLIMVETPTAGASLI